MRVLACALVGASLALLAPRGTEAARSKRSAKPDCAFAQRSLLTSDTQAEIYERAAVPSPEVYGCVYGSRHIQRLGPVAYRYSTKYMEEGFFGISHEVLAGPLVAYAEIAGPVGCGFCHWAVIVHNLRTGRTLTREPTGKPVNPALQENYGVGPVTAIVLKSDGAVAWIADARAAEGRPSEGGYQVHADDRSGSRLLASSEDIEPGSLALAGSIVYWSENGKPFSAPLN
jgi:hypothetical protein